MIPNDLSTPLTDEQMECAQVAAMSMLLLFKIAFNKKEYNNYVKNWIDSHKLGIKRYTWINLDKKEEQCRKKKHYSVAAVKRTIL